MLDIETLLKVYELGQKHGKKAGDNLQEEFDEIKLMYPEKFSFLGTTKLDKDLILGNLREETKLKILDLTKKENKDDKSN